MINVSKKKSDKSEDDRKCRTWKLPLPPGRRRKVRLRKSLMQEVITGMREKGIDSMECIDRNKWIIK